MKKSNIFSNKSEPTLVDIYFDLYLKLQEEVGEDIILKGNILLNKILPDNARSTIDLDTSIINEKIYYECAVPVLEKFGEDCISEGLADTFEVREIKERRSGGIDLKLGGSKVLSVDISLQKIFSLYSFKKYLFDLREIKGASVEKIMADKCLSTLSKKRFRRAKDFYDLWIIKKSGLEYDYTIIKKLMIKTVGNEKYNKLLDNYPFSEEIIIHMVHAWRKLNLTRDNDGTDIDKPNFNEVLNTCSTIYSKLQVEV